MREYFTFIWLTMFQNKKEWQHKHQASTSNSLHVYKYLANKAPLMQAYSVWMYFEFLYAKLVLKQTNIFRTKIKSNLKVMSEFGH